jgi:TRAP-type mannitol/chloroaromatic compound transport system substrate-binding protein
MQRRDFIKHGGIAGVLAAGAAPAFAQNQPISWRMTSSFPKSLDTLYGANEMVAKRVAELTNNRLQLKTFAAGEIVPGLQVLDAVQNATVEVGQTALYYYFGKDPAFGFASCLPFGLNTRQQNAWWYYGGGEQLYAEFLKKYNCVAFPGYNTGCQMGGWYRKEIKSIADIKNLKMRRGGPGGVILNRMGATPQQIAGGDIYPALEKGTIDAAEWVGPYDDEKLGFYKVAKNYYTPGWWEPNSAYSFYVNLKEWEKLPKEYQAAFEAAAYAVNADMMAEYDAKNPTALKRLISSGVKLHSFSNDIMKAAQDAAYGLYDDEAAKNPAFKKIYLSWLKFRDDQLQWHRVAEHTMASFSFANRPKIKTTA